MCVRISSEDVIGSGVSQTGLPRTKMEGPARGSSWEHSELKALSWVRGSLKSCRSS